ncbi:hypothetical protein GCM10027404_14330 [Arthrobacter tumbae]|uniref:hypothetical protein n=1 Tax=Arthrobacter tumbae TaxID=163874 RepID=UPI00195736E2|nr:hypothetical protein [Arthrobacter tumbae]MBM7782716.1 hypothetical protein [Arthrobacter tumbae]
MARIAGGFACVLALAGCSADPPDEHPPERQTQTAAPAEPSAAGTQTPATSEPAATPSSTPGSGSRLSAEQLEAVLAAVNEAESLNAQIIADGELRALEEEGARRAEDIAVTPEECNVYAESSPEGLSAEASRAAMTFAGESSLQPDTVSLSGLTSEGAAGAQIRASRNQLNACSEFTMEVSSQEIRTTVAEIEVETAADQDLALRTTAQVPGTIQESLTVRAAVGGTVVDVLVGGSTDPAADVARAERLTNLVVAELRAP